MIEHLGLLTFAALGHFCLFVAVINRMHGLGHMPHWADRLVVVATLGFGVVSLGGAAWLIGHPWADYPIPARGYLVVCAVVGGVILPAVTIGRSLRRLPAGIHGSSRTIDLAAEHGAASLIGDGPRAKWLRIPGNDSLRLRINHWRIARPDLPAALDGMSILHVSDLHFALAYRRDFFDRVVDALDSEPVDLVLFTGDLIDDAEAICWIEPVMSRLKGRLGSFAILGNHDFHHDDAAIVRELERSGFEVVEGRWTVLEERGARLAIGGNGAPWGPRPERGALPPADFSILLSHAPDQFRWGVREGVDLIVSGHNHGGQVRLPVVGPVLMPSLYGRRFDRGFFRRGRTLLYSNQGVGAKHPLRWNCLPEIARFELRAVRPVSSSPADAVRRQDDPLTSASGGRLASS